MLGIFGIHLSAGYLAWLAALVSVHVFTGPLKIADQCFWAASVALGSSYLSVFMLEAICNDTSPQKRNNLTMAHLGRTAMSGRFRCSKTLGSAPRTWFRTTGSRRSPPSGWWRQVKGTLIEWLNWGYGWPHFLFYRLVIEQSLGKSHFV